MTKKVFKCSGVCVRVNKPGFLKKSPTRDSLRFKYIRPVTNLESVFALTN